MKTIKRYFLPLVVVLACVTGICATSCSDDIPSDKYYTFTGEMMSDYLKSRPQFSKFVQIVERTTYSERGVDIMDLISTYGQFTCFAPDNDAVDAYLRENGYSSVDAIPASICDTIARTHLINGRAFGTEDLLGVSSLSSVNMNDRYLQVKSAYAYVENGDTIYTTDELSQIEDKNDIHSTYCLNRTGCIYFNACNDSVENGIVHTVNAVIVSSNQSVFDLVEENEDLSLFAQAMRLVGLAEYIQGHIKDTSWDPDLYEDKHVYSGAQTDYCHIPETKNYGFTVFACPDKVLSERYGIETLQDFYNYARSIYGGDNIDVEDPANEEYLKDWRSPLRRLIGYNILKQKGQYSDLTSITTIYTDAVNPTEWYATMDSLTTIKIEKLYVTRYVGYGEHDERERLFLNRGDMSRGCYTPGIRVYSPDDMTADYDIDGSNGIYFTTDGLADYGETTKQDIFNTRMRMDLYYMFPELMTNNVRDGRTNNYIANSDNPDKSVTSPNYWFPNGYLDNVKVNDDGIFLFQSQHNTYWSYEGDEFNLASDVNSYDITFNLPSVPSGTYQIRLGFAPMSTRGICQFYLDGQPQGIPFDMRDTNLETRIGFFALTSNTYSSDELEAAKKNMHNMGWYHGPRSVFNYGTEGTVDGTNSTRNFFCNNIHTMRYVLCTANLDEDIQHTVRIKSIWAVGTALVMIDYLELVPKSVYGVEGEGKAEDDY